MYCLNMLAIALELARRGPGLRGRREQVLRALRLHRARDERHAADEGIELWDEEDGFFYDVLHLPDGAAQPAEGALDGRADPALRRRDARARGARPAARASSAGMQWFLENRPDFAEHVALHGHAGRRRAPPALARRRASGSRRVLRVHARRERVPLAVRHPRAVARPPRPPVRRSTWTASSTAWTTSRRSRTTGLFGGNSNWRGPIWFPVNFLLIESLQKFHHYLRRRASRSSARRARAS